MNNSAQKIHDLILNNNNLINEKISGINYLEKLKYIILENIKKFEKTGMNNLTEELKKNNNQKNNFDFKDQTLEVDISYFKNSLTKIKHSCDNDKLSIVLSGFKTVSLFDSNDTNKSVNLPISNNMGIVLSENTITSEIIAADSTILNVILKKKLNAEKK